MRLFSNRLQFKVSDQFYAIKYRMSLVVRSPTPKGMVFLAENPMIDNSAPLFERYADPDFSNAELISVVPTLGKLQAERGGRSHLNHQGRYR